MSLENYMLSFYTQKKTIRYQLFFNINNNGTSMHHLVHYPPMSKALLKLNKHKTSPHVFSLHQTMLHNKINI